MRIIVAGGRDFSDYELMVRELDRLLANLKQPILVSGMARGADALAVRYARQRGLGLIEMPADWAKHGRAAGMIRNSEMLKVADALVAFWDGSSRGTGDMISKARSAGKKVRIIRY